MGLDTSSTQMWHKPTRISRNGSIRFANADTCCGVTFFMTDYPASYDGIHSAETFQRPHILVDESFFAVAAAGLEIPTRLMERNISTLPPDQRLPNPVARGPFEARREQVRMIGIEFPQHRQNSFVR